MEEDNQSETFITSTDCNDAEVECFDSGICLSTSSICSEVEASMRILSLGKVIEENEHAVSEALSDVPTEALFYQNHDGDTLLHLALICNNLEYVTYVIKRAINKAQLDIQNYKFYQTPLHLSISMGNLAATKLLLEAGASRTLKDHEGNNPLHIACAMGDFRQVKEIFAEGKKSTDVINMKDMNYQGKTCLHLASESTSNDRFQILEFLVCKRGADPSMKEGTGGFTILHELVRAGDLPAIKFLTGLPRLNVNSPAYDGSTPLDLALQTCDSDVAEALLCRGALTSGSSLSYSSSDSCSD